MQGGPEIFRELSPKQSQVVYNVTATEHGTPALEVPVRQLHNAAHCLHSQLPGRPDTCNFVGETERAVMQQICKQRGREIHQEL